MRTLAAYGRADPGSDPGSGGGSVYDRPAVSRVPAPPSGSTPRLVARTAEVERLLAALVDGHPVVVTGAPGMGKTRLVHHALDQSGRRHRDGAGIDFLGHHSLLPIRQLLGRTPADGDAAAVAEEVIVEVGDDLVVLDDLQWADDETLAVLPYLAKGVQLVAVCRSGSRADHVVDALPDGVHIELGPLRDAEVAELVGSIVPSADPLLVAQVQARSGGHPLSVEVLCLEARGGSAVGPELALEAAVDACSVEERQVLALAGLRDPGIEVDDLRVVALGDRGLVVIDADGRVRPRGDVIGELALARLDAATRRAVHRRIADAVEDPADRAFHLAAAGELEGARAAAGVALSQRTSVPERIELLRLAAGLADGVARLDLAREAGQLLLRLGRVDEAWAVCQEHFEGVDDLPPAHSLALEAMRARMMIDAGDAAGAIALIDQQLPRCDATTRQEEYHLRTARAGASALSLDLPGAVAAVTEAVAFADGHGLTSTRARSIDAMLRAFVGDPAGIAIADDLLDRAVDDPEPHIAFETGCLFARAQVLGGGGSGDVEARLARLVSLAESRNQRAWLAEVRVIALTADVLDPTRSDPRVELRWLLDAPAARARRAEVLALLAIAEIDRGGLEQARALLDADAASPASPADRTRLTWARAELAWHLGVPVALPTPEITSVALFDPAWHHLGVLRRWFTLAEGGDVDACPQALPLLPGLAGFTAESDAIGLVARGDAGAAAERFLAAATDHERCLRRDAFRCRWAAGDALARTSERERATALLLELRAECERAGHLALHPRIDRTLRTLGIAAPRSSPRTSAPGAALTPRQRQVLRLVGEGRTTADIAALLQLSPQTVDTHVKHAMRALGARSRREAALLASESEP